MAFLKAALTAVLLAAGTQVLAQDSPLEPCAKAEFAAAKSYEEINLASLRCHWYRNAMTELQKLEYDAGAAKRRADAFEWHAFTSRMLFWVVLALIFVSTVLSVLQFGRKERAAITLKVGTGAMELSTAVVGFVMLAFSMGFFYLYLGEVYELVEMNKSIEQTQPPKKPSPPE
jgi:hypothetical protein